jgi:hypothetical protein
MSIRIHKLPISTSLKFGLLIVGDYGLIKDMIVVKL